jgi:hypothetical protein
MSAINGLEQAIANLNSISKTAVPVLLLRLLTGSRARRQPKRPHCRNGHEGAT